MNGQISGYNGIQIQIELRNANSAEIDLEFIIKDFSGDTLWKESHDAVQLTIENSCDLVLGQGINSGGSENQFISINWLEVVSIEIRRTDLINDYTIANYSLLPVPYAFHSLTVDQIPLTIELVDFDLVDLDFGKTIKFNGQGFYPSIDLIADTSQFSFVANHTDFCDTASIGVIQMSYTDSALYAYLVDSADYTYNFNYVLSSDSTGYADTANVASYSINNWGLNGNAGLNVSNYTGTINNENFTLTTNSIPRLTFGTNGDVYNALIGTGFQYQSAGGILFTPNTNPGLSFISGSYLYFDGNGNSLSGGQSVLGLDTCLGNYSISWGENTGTNGTYSAVFGKNTYGDSTLLGAVTYEAISSFALGKDCRTTYMGVAIGDNAKATYFRNVAIGKDVTAGSFSAGIAIGNNVMSSGATSWAIGHNLSANGHYTTLLGCNAGSDYQGCFVFGDLSTSDTVYSNAIHQFVVRASGGVIFYTTSDLSMGVELSPGGGSWNMISDSSKKYNIRQLNYLEYKPVFDSLNVYNWNYKNQPVTHIGPMAQNFYSSFHVGEKPSFINMIDFDGAILTGIKIGKERIENQIITNEIDETRNNLDEEKKKLLELEKRIILLYEKIDQ